MDGTPKALRLLIEEWQAKSYDDKRRVGKRAVYGANAMTLLSWAKEWDAELDKLEAETKSEVLLSGFVREKMLGVLGSTKVGTVIIRYNQERKRVT